MWQPDLCSAAGPAQAEPLAGRRAVNDCACRVCCILDMALLPNRASAKIVQPCHAGTARRFPEPCYRLARSPPCAAERLGCTPPAPCCCACACAARSCACRGGRAAAGGGRSRLSRQAQRLLASNKLSSCPTTHLQRLNFIPHLFQGRLVPLPATARQYAPLGMQVPPCSAAAAAAVAATAPTRASTRQQWRRRLAQAGGGSGGALEPQRLLHRRQLLQRQLEDEQPDCMGEGGAPSRQGVS